MKKISLIFALLLIGCFAQSSIFNLIPITKADDDGAICMDGSHGAYYISEGAGANANSFLVYFQGGQVCSLLNMAASMENCAKLSQTPVGSSKHYTSTMNNSNHSLLSADPAVNPNFYDWTRVLLMYCDGSGHQGSTYLGLGWKLITFHLRGENITKGLFASLQNSHQFLSKGNRIVLAGSSVGGIAALLWANHVKQNAKGQVYAIADSAAYLNAVNTSTNLQDYGNQLYNIIRLCSVDASPPIDDCVDDFYNDGDIWKCLLVEVIVKYLKVPALVINSLYDPYALQHIVGINCIKGTHSLAGCSAAQRAIIESYKQNVTDLFNSFTGTTVTGLWAPACVHSSILNTTLAVSPKYSVPEGSNFTVAYTIGQWLKQPTASLVHVDQGSWPSNQACSN